ncbi:LPXTG cell wall anchor domain-containing protein [Lactococcus formosensis]|uniref:LPXTG cell wall anchor domain-containing protein n=1 Tax=Lactococcus formosensis TaxID=1281486 RepID=A0A9X4P5Y5_9LACT|nr:LPXTG cell wall anchor domain-containing protein [Lactococcus formosensis]MDG6113368.1 LPXTG cell wall anchor domain-containing protein [Lactococcus formosensis]MDG6116519.1 LPXTG cell wall anchor domain-containing protein [Lactococcus formosensis]MDG6121603.1 LPXTG cell wall anchor domain-containing protein [Lactococcus formosensis]MDG6123165.1 LPXTG cell wall anchor domain-containing protein [Lactococcus formosensis]MDG6128088.1 LPXTG cell wall anchor domain-containing protein [Lactococcu
MKKRRLLALIFFFSIILLRWNNAPIQAAERHSQNIIIVKYGLTSASHGFSTDQSFNTGLKINNIIIDNEGKELQPVADISYTVQQITEKDGLAVMDPSSYTKVGNPIKLMTNKEGIASIRLGDGKYILTEQANSAAGLNIPQAPVLLDLPTADRLEEIYIYPKSNLVRVEKKPTQHYPKLTQIYYRNDLPHTGEKISWFIALSGAFLLIIVAFVLNRKEKSTQTK